jgi:hypothetical protein
MEYNSEREHLVIPEYGRHIQKMVNHALTIENREERNNVANAIIQVMGQLNPHLRDIEDFAHKLWDHLFLISNFKLDVDSPYPKPNPENFREKPQGLKYPRKNIKYSFYGKNIELMIDEAAKMEDEEIKNKYIQIVANLMKRMYLNWNTDSVSDSLIFSHLQEMSNGKIKTEHLTLANTNDLINTPNKKPQSNHLHKRKRKPKTQIRKRI